MLNIDDIRKKLRDHPIPEEVKDIRRKITETFSDLEFIEEGHKYYLHKANGEIKEMTSVTTFCEQEFQPFVNWDTILINKAEKLGISPDILRREWKEKNITSTSNGTLTHLFAEAYMYFYLGEPENMPEVIRKMQYEDGFLIPYGNKQKAVAKYYEDMFQTEGFYPVMPEARIYIESGNNPYGMNVNISGTFDALFAFQDKKTCEWKLSIRDWKTNKSLVNDYNRSNVITLLPPFNDLIDENTSHYTLQLSTYQLGIQQLGYKITDRKLLWLTEEADYYKIDVPDVTDRIISHCKS